MPKPKKYLAFAIDFDGTLAEHKFPDIGKEVPGAVQTCKDLMDAGYTLVLNTMRSREHLDAAKEWCQERGLDFKGWNKHPDQHKFTESPKVYSDVYIDDAALGCPLVFPKPGVRPYVDWTVVRKVLVDNGIL